MPNNYEIPPCLTLLWTEHEHESLSADCNRDLSQSDMLFASDTLPCYLIYLLFCCFTSTVNIEGHVGTVS